MCKLRVGQYYRVVSLGSGFNILMSRLWKEHPVRQCTGILFLQTEDDDYKAKFTHDEEFWWYHDSDFELVLQPVNYRGEEYV